MPGSTRAGLPTRLQLTVLAADIAIGCLISIFVLDLDLARSVHGSSDPLSRLLAAITPDLGAPRMVALVSVPLAFAVLFMWNEQVGRKALFLVGTILIAYLASLVLKFVFGRSRPELLFEADTHVFAFGHWRYQFHSFPSAHAAIAVGFAMALSDLREARRLLIQAIGLAVGALPVATGSHFLSDVFMGFGVGVGAYAACKALLLAYGVDPLSEGGATTKIRRRR